MTNFILAENTGPATFWRHYRIEQLLVSLCVGLNVGLRSRLRRSLVRGHPRHHLWPVTRWAFLFISGCGLRGPLMAHNEGIVPAATSIAMPKARSRQATG